VLKGLYGFVSVEDNTNKYYSDDSWNDFTDKLRVAEEVLANSSDDTTTDAYIISCVQPLTVCVAVILLSVIWILTES